MDFVASVGRIEERSDAAPAAAVAGTRYAWSGLRLQVELREFQVVTNGVTGRRPADGNGRFQLPATVPANVAALATPV